MIGPLVTRRYPRRVVFILSSIFAGAGTGLVLAATGFAPTPREIASMALEEVRIARREREPACATKFTSCRDGKICVIQPNARDGQPNEDPDWTSCQIEAEAWQRRQYAARERLLTLDPIPNCFDPDPDFYLAKGISPHSPERNLLLIRKGVPLGNQDCTKTVCAWIRRNADDVPSVVEACDRLLSRPLQ